MRSLFLKERFDLAPLIAQLQGAEWQHLYRDWNAAHALKDFEAEKSDGGLPTTMNLKQNFLCRENFGEGKRKYLEIYLKRD